MHHHKEKSITLIKEIEEVLSRNKSRQQSPLFFESKEMNSITFSENKRKNYKSPKKQQSPDLQDQINNSFKSLSIQTINALISLKGGQNNNSSAKKSKGSPKKPVPLQKTIINEKFDTNNINKLKERITGQIKGLKSIKGVDLLINGLNEKMKGFQESYERINGRIEELLKEMKPAEMSPVITEGGKEELRYYTFQKSKQNSGEKRYGGVKKFEEFD